MTEVSPGDVRAFIISRVAGQLEARRLDPSALPEDFDLLEEGMIDSFGIVELLADLEHHFGAEIDFEPLDAERITVLGALCQHVAAELQEAA